MKKWQILSALDEKTFAAYPEINPVLLQLLFNRGLTNSSAIHSFLNNELEKEKTLMIGDNPDHSFYDPFLFKNMAVATDLIIDHIKKGDPIIIYGDYDADGVTSSVVLLEVLKTLQATVEAYLPDRVTEGYGLNKKALKEIAEQGFKLLITVDNGIRNYQEVLYAKELGLEVIITDHHMLPENSKELPNCLYINPADKNDNYPWSLLAGVGVAFKLASALLYKAKLPIRQKQLILERSLDLVAIGTVADMVSLLGENRLLVKNGLKILNEGKRLGIRELIKESKINTDRELEAWNIGWQLGPRLNAASRLSHANTAFALLTTDKQEEAEELAHELNQRNLSRQKITEEIMTEVESKINKDNLPKIIIGVAGSGQIWNEGVIGLVAGKITERYYRPTLIISRIVEEFGFDEKLKKMVPKKITFKGSGRSVEGFNLISAIESCSQELNKYGGHPMACGFSIKTEDDLNKFIEKIKTVADKELKNEDLVPKLKIEMILNFLEIDLTLAEEIARLSPFGQNNQAPKFVSHNLRIEDIVTMGTDNQHIKIKLSQLDKEGEVAGSMFWGISFNGTKTYHNLEISDKIDLVYYLEINEFNGRREVQLKIIDLKKYD